MSDKGKGGLIATAAVSSVALLVYSYACQKSKTKKYKVPPELAASPCGKEVRVALELALQAGRNMISYCEQRGTTKEISIGIETKGQPEDFCTAIDVENEALVIKGIKKNFPTHKIIGEESVGTGNIPPLTNYPTWIIDPIDGTTNFAAGNPLTCVSIGFCVDGKPVAGIVYAPMTDEVYLAVSGHGAYRNGEKLAPRRVNPPSLENAVVCFEFGYARQESAVSKMVGAVKKILLHGCRTCRCIGSGVLDLCWVASSRLDVVYAGVANEGWKPWGKFSDCSLFLAFESVGLTTLEPRLLRWLRCRHGSWMCHAGD